MVNNSISCALFWVFGVAYAGSSADDLYQQAVEYNQQGFLVEASVLLTEAISLDGSQARYYYQRGLSLVGMDQLEAGMQDFKSAVNLKSTELKAYLKLISYDMEKSRYQAVLITTDQLLANLPEQAAGAYYDQGRAYEAMGKPELAMAAYQKVIASLAPEMSDFKQQLTDKVKKIKHNRLKER